MFTSKGEKPLTAGLYFEYIDAFLVRCFVFTEILLALFATKRFSDRNTNEYKKEESTYMMFRDMIDDFEGIKIIRM